MWGTKALFPASGNVRIGRTVCGAASIQKKSSQVQRLGLTTTHTEFMSWLRNRGEDVSCIAVAIAMSEYGRALFAARPICAGECMMKFSQDLVLTPEKLPQQVISLLDKANEFTRVSLLVMAEKLKGQASAWAPYIQCLPDFGEIHSTIFWDKKELACLECSPLYRGTFERNALLNFEYKEVAKVVAACPHIYGESVSLEQFKHAYATVSSRAWGEGPHSDMTMIPLVDFANHSPRTRTIFSYDAEVDTTVVVVADRDYQTGDEVHISYGNHSNAVLALDYGFAVPENPFDEAEIWLEIPFEDPLRERKLQYLLQNNMNTLRNSDGSQSGGLPFTILEVNCPGGKEVIVPPLARAFARVICSNSLEDLEELNKEAEVFRVVPFASRPRQDKAKEAKAMKFLSSLIQTHVDEHLKALQVLREAVSIPERREIAECVLQGELLLLQKATIWLKDHSSAL